MILSGTRPANHHRLPAADDCADQPRNRVFERHKIGSQADGPGPLGLSGVAAGWQNAGRSVSICYETIGCD